MSPGEKYFPFKVLAGDLAGDPFSSRTN